MRSMEINNKNAHNELAFTKDKMSRLEADYQKLSHEHSSFKMAPNRSNNNLSEANEIELRNLQADNNQLNGKNAQLSATVEYFQKDNERLKNELNDMKAKTGLTNIKDSPANTNGKIANFQSALQTYIYEKDQQIREVRTLTPCKVTEVRTRYEKSPTSVRFINHDSSHNAGSNRKVITSTIVTDNASSLMKEIEYLRADNARLQKQVHELIASNNDYRFTNDSLRRQLADTADIKNSRRQIITLN